MRCPRRDGEKAEKAEENAKKENFVGRRVSLVKVHGCVCGNPGLFSKCDEFIFQMNLSSAL